MRGLDSRAAAHIRSGGLRGLRLVAVRGFDEKRTQMNFAEIIFPRAFRTLGLDMCFEVGRYTRGSRRRLGQRHYSASTGHKACKYREGIAYICSKQWKTRKGVGPELYGMSFSVSIVAERAEVAFGEGMVWYGMVW